MKIVIKRQFTNNLNSTPSLPELNQLANLANTTNYLLDDDHNSPQDYFINQRHLPSNEVQITRINVSAIVACHIQKELHSMICNEHTLYCRYRQNPNAIHLLVTLIL